METNYDTRIDFDEYNNMIADDLLSDGPIKKAIDGGIITINAELKQDSRAMALAEMIFEYHQIQLAIKNLEDQKKVIALGIKEELEHYPEGAVKTTTGLGVTTVRKETLKVIDPDAVPSSFTKQVPDSKLILAKIKLGGVVPGCMKKDSSHIMCRELKK